MPLGFEGQNILVPGTKEGYRGFNLDKFGRLRSPSKDFIWQPGENYAECNRYDKCSIPGGKKCGCGFHAYHGTHCDEFTYGGKITGVIQSTGRMTIGSHGFKAPNGTIVALIEPECVKKFTKSAFHEKYDALSDRVYAEWYLWPATMALITIFLLLVFILGGSEVDFWCAIGFGSLIGFAADMFTTRMHGHARHRWPNITKCVKKYDHSGVREAWEKCLLLYPDVVVFRSTAEALKSYPAPVVEEPALNPDDKKFWTQKSQVVF